MRVIPRKLQCPSNIYIINWQSLFSGFERVEGVKAGLGVMKTLYMAGRGPCHVATENVNTVWKNIRWFSYPVAALRYCGCGR